MKRLLVILGPTAVGKTALSLEIAESLGSPVISADSRLFYRGLNIGVAAPSAEDLQRVRHYFVHHLDLDTYYSASQFETDALALLETLFAERDTVVVCGGSMLYLDALCRGIDEIPTIDPALREELKSLYHTEGIDAISSRLKLLDPEIYGQIDLRNHKRVIHALEVCLMTGKPYSSLRTNTPKQRQFEIVKIGLQRDRSELYERINRRVDAMIEAGLEDEARSLYPQRHLNSLDTVGYKELFRYFSGEWERDFAIEKIKQNTRNYARKQMSWFRRDPEIKWIVISHPLSLAEQLALLSSAAARFQTPF